MKISKLNIEIIAVICMTIGNFTKAFADKIPETMQNYGLFIGGFAFPIFAVLIVNEYGKTKYLPKTKNQLGEWAIILQIPYIWAIIPKNSPSSVIEDGTEIINIIGALWLGIVALNLQNKIKNPFGYAVSMILILFLLRNFEFSVCGIFIFICLGFASQLKNNLKLYKFGIILALQTPIIWTIANSDISGGLGDNFLTYGGASCAGILFLFYDEKQNRQKTKIKNRKLKWIYKNSFYIYYAVHLLIFALIKNFI